MNIISDLGLFVSNSLTIWAVALLLVAWAVGSGVDLRRKCAKLCRSLSSARLKLAQSDSALTFRSHYEIFSDDLAQHKVLGPSWRAYRDSLIVPGDGRPVRSTVRPEVWFDLAGLLRTVGIDARYHAALPNLLVGAGLLFTFLGLAVALDSAGGIVAPNVDAEKRNLELKSLLDAAAFKFITSLVGLLLSLAYALCRKRALKSVEKALDDFLAGLESRIPLLTPAALQQEANGWLEKQSSQLETFSTELAVNIGSAFDKAFDQRLGEHIGPLTEAIQKLSGGMASRNEDAMQHMLAAFLDRLQGATGDRMQGVAESLAQLGSRLEELQSGLGDAAVRMAQSADTMVARMGEGAESALHRITDQMGGLVESLRAVADQTRAAGASAGDLLAQRIEQAASGFEASARTVAESLAEAARGMERRMADEAATSSAKLAAQFEAMIGELQRLAEASRATGSAAFEALAERIGAAAAGFEETARRIAEAMRDAANTAGGTFGKGAADAVTRIAEATEGMRTDLQATLVEFRRSMSDAGDTVRAGAREGGEVLRGTMENASAALATAVTGVAADLKDAGTAAGSALRQGGETAASSLTDSAGTLTSRAEGLAGRVRELGVAVDRLAERIVALEQATRDVTSPLVTTAGDLRATAEAAHAAVRPLHAISGDLRAAAEQMSGTAQRLDGAHQAAARLTDGLNVATGRFEKIDTAMAATVQELMNGLQGFTNKVREFVHATDRDLANAAMHLGSLTKNLEETLAEYLDHVKSGVRA